MLLPCVIGNQDYKLGDVPNELLARSVGRPLDIDGDELQSGGQSKSWMVSGERSPSR